MKSLTYRLDKHLANLGVCSRRNVEGLLSVKILTVNGKRVVKPGMRIDPARDVIKLEGKSIASPVRVYYAVNKPKGVVSTVSDELGRKNVLSLVPHTERIYPVGRLDRDTTGLILLTNDGALANLLTHPRYHVHKVYRLTVKGKVNPNQLKAFQNGVRLEDGKTAPAEAEILQIGNDTSIVEITLHEGKNRQIRRMCQAVGLFLLELVRVKLGPVTLGNLKEGEYRLLSAAEVEALRAAAITQ